MFKIDIICKCSDLKLIFLDQFYAANFKLHGSCTKFITVNNVSTNLCYVNIQNVMPQKQAWIRLCPLVLSAGYIRCWIMPQQWRDECMAVYCWLHSEIAAYDKSITTTYRTGRDLSLSISGVWPAFFLHRSHISVIVFVHFGLHFAYFIWHALIEVCRDMFHFERATVVNRTKKFMDKYAI